MQTIHRVALWAGLLLFCLFVATVFSWQGSKQTYLLMSVTFTALLFFAIKKQLSSSYIFLATVVWLGFWLKLSVHVLAPSLPWIEPIGAFDFSRDAWDEVATVSSVGALAVLIAGLLISWIKPRIFKSTNSQYVADIETCSLEALTQRRLINSWWMGLTVIFFMVLLNESYHVVRQAVPPVDLGWPAHLQGLFNWSLGGGVFYLLMMPLYLEVVSGHIVKGGAWFVFASFLVGVSLYSRGTVVFESLIMLIPLLVYREYFPRFKLNQLLKVGVLVCCGVALSVVISQVRREAFFVSVQPVSVQPVSVQPVSVQPVSVQPVSVQPVSVQPVSVQPVSVQPVFSSYTFFSILKLPIERWIGLEGLMSVSAHTGKGLELLVKAIKEERVIGKTDMYTHEVALSPSIDNTTVAYASPPSFFAFWYYSGSLIVLFIVVALTTLLLSVIEIAIIAVSGNPFLGAAVGVGGAVQLLHLGTGGLRIPLVIFATSVVVGLSISIELAYKRRKRRINAV